MAKYEAHITFDKVHEKALKDPTAVLREDFRLSGWQYSAIDDDPIMGQKPYCYLTAYDPDPQNLKRRMLEVSEAVIDHGIHGLRFKIERIVYDSKTGVDELTSPTIMEGSPAYAVAYE